MLAKGKSGTIVSASATGRAGQLKNDGSTILTLVSRPALISTRCTIVPPPLHDADARARRSGWLLDRLGIVGGRGPQPRDEIGDQGDGLLDLLDAHQETGQHVAVGGPWLGGRGGHPWYRMIAPGVDGQPARPGDVPQRSQIDGLLAGEHSSAGEPVPHHAVTHCEGGDLADIGADLGQPSRIRQCRHIDAAQQYAAAQQPVAGDLVVDPQQVFLHPLCLVVQDRVPDVIAQRADVCDVVVHPFQLEQYGPHLSIRHGNGCAASVLDGLAERQGVPDRGVPADPFGQLDSLCGRPCLEELLDAAVHEPQAHLQVQDGLANDGEPEMARADHSRVHRANRDLVHPSAFHDPEAERAVHVTERGWLAGPGEHRVPTGWPVEVAHQPARHGVLVRDDAEQVTYLAFEAAGGERQAGQARHMRIGRVAAQVQFDALIGGGMQEQVHHSHVLGNSLSAPGGCTHSVVTGHQGNPEAVVQ